jgi:hypothetical protein
MLVKQHDLKRGGLMIVAGAVMVANVLIWALPGR